MLKLPIAMIAAGDRSLVSSYVGCGGSTVVRKEEKSAMELKREPDFAPHISRAFPIVSY